MKYQPKMAPIHVAQFRLRNQRIANTSFTEPKDVVHWMGAVQAQDYLGSLWAIALRMQNATERDIEKAIADKTIVRTWPMRGTLHFVAATDLRWMLNLLGPRVIARSAPAINSSNWTNLYSARAILCSRGHSAVIGSLRARN